LTATALSLLADILTDEGNDNFQSLHRDPRFDALLAAARQRIAAKMQPATK
jgi:hypothetical protein